MGYLADSGIGHIQIGYNEEVKMSSVFAFFGYAGLMLFGAMIMVSIWAWLWRDGGYGG